MIEKRYLGDAVYVEHDGFHVVLTTSDGMQVTNRICLEPGVIVSFNQWLVDLKEAIYGATHPESKPEQIVKEAETDKDSETHIPELGSESV